MANEKSIAIETMEIAKLIGGVDIAVKALLAHPAYNRVMEFGTMLEAFSTGQPKPNSKPPQTRVRRSKAEIEKERAENAALVKELTGK